MHDEYRTSSFLKLVKKELNNTGTVTALYLVFGPHIFTDYMFQIRVV